MKALYKVINTQNVYDLGVRLGDVVEAEKLNSDCFKAYPRQHLTEWTMEFVLFRLYQLEKIRNTAEPKYGPAVSGNWAGEFACKATPTALAPDGFGVSLDVSPEITGIPISELHGGVLASEEARLFTQQAPPNPENDLPLSEVPPEAKEASTVLPVPSTRIDKDKRKYRFTPLVYQDGTLDHYRLMASLPVRLDPALEHAAKKLLFPGQRGAKGELQDLREVIKSVQVYIDYKTAQTERDH